MRIVWIACLIVLLPLDAFALDPLAKRALSDGDAALRRGDFAAALVAAEEARRIAADPPEGGEATVKALRLIGEVKLAEKKYLGAARSFKAAAHLSGSDHRLWRGSNERRVAALKKAERAPAEQRVRELITKYDALVALSRAAAVGPDALAAAQRTLEEAMAALKADRDQIHLTFAEAVRAKVYAWSGEHVRAAVLVQPLVLSQRPVFIRKIALDAAIRAATVNQDLPAEIRYGFELDAILFADKPLEERRFLRSASLDRACQKYETTEGEGRCALIAQEVTGELSFKDPWKQKIKPTLTADEIEQAQQQYLPAVQDCIAVAVKARPDDAMFQDASLRVGWAVTPQGRTTEVEIEPKRYEQVLGKCVRERVAWFRYPRAKDQQVHSVSIPFQLDVEERIGRR